MKKILVSIAAASALLLSMHSYADPHKSGDYLFRGGLTTSITSEGKTKINFGSSETNHWLNVDDAYALGLNFAYFFDRSWAIEVATTSPLKHNIQVSGDNVNNKFAKMSNMPIIVSALYYPDKDWDLKPYVGAGLHYTFVFGDKFTTTGENLGYDNLDISDGYGFALQAGIDYQFTRAWSINTSARYLGLKSKSSFYYRSSTVKDKATLDINPWVISVMVGYQF